jgi:hypothetical protein
MKTMMELLIRLQELRGCCERTAQNSQLTRSEKAAPSCLKELVRDSLPADVVNHYNRLKKSAPDLLQCPEVFAMAVIVSAYRSLSPRKRQKLVDHFATQPSVACGGNGHTATRPPRLRRERRSRTARHHPRSVRQTSRRQRSPRQSAH